MTHIEALKQARELAHQIACGNYDGNAQDVLEQLDQAIEQAEKQAALDAKADNARELGLDYEPVAWNDKVGGIGFSRPMPNANYKVTATIVPAQNQEPIAWLCQKENGHFDVLTDQTCKKCFPVYTHPPVPQGHKPKAEPAVSVQWLAEMVMSDCGCSTNNQRLLERIADRIEQHIRANTPEEAQPKAAVPTEHKQEPVAWSDYEYDGVRNKPVAWMDADGNISDNNDYKCFPIPLFTYAQPKADTSPQPQQFTYVGFLVIDDSGIPVPVYTFKE